MAEDIQQGSKVSKGVQKEGAAGTRVDPYPYIGIVKNNVDPTRAGRLQVWIADFGGDANDPSNWRTVSYASPYMGTTNTQTTKNETNVWTECPQTYGMWMTPPDIGVEVLVTFISGDPQKGYWFACISSAISRYMLPGNSTSKHFDKSEDALPNDIKKVYDAAVKTNDGLDLPVPVTEFNTSKKEFAIDPKFVNIARPMHVPQYLILVNQGLDRDQYRGLITSSSQRETPSNVFGISTPGRPKDDPTLADGYDEKAKAGNLTETDYAIKSRVGGHTFVMDDGDKKGGNQLIRIRTASGHQIVMNDTVEISTGSDGKTTTAKKDCIYICKNDGSVWLEFTDEGKMHFYSDNGIDIRTKGAMNFHSDSDINFNAVGKLNIKTEAATQFDFKSLIVTSAEGIVMSASAKTEFKSGGGFNVETGGKMSLKASSDVAIAGASIKQNSGGTVGVKQPKPIPVNKLYDTSFKDGTIWVQEPEKLRSIVAFAPSREPSYRKSMSKIVVGEAPPDPSVGVPPKTSGPQDSKTNQDTTPDENGVVHYGEFTGAAATPIPNQITEDDIRKQPLSSTSVGSLSKEHVTCLFAQLSKGIV